VKKLIYKFVLPVLYPLLQFYWYIVHPKATGVKCALLREDRVLLIRNSYGLRLWTLPGGGVKRGETIESAVIREMQEEVGISITNPKNCGSMSYDEDHRRDKVWIFVAKASSEQFLIDGIEIEEARWFPIVELPPRKSHLLKEFLRMAQTQ
jgi:mutator protein MutT